MRRELIRPDRRITPRRDPNDGKFLEVAVIGRAQVLVSGDDDLLALNPSKQIAIVPPDRFLAMFDAVEPRSRQ